MLSLHSWMQFALFALRAVGFLRRAHRASVYQPYHEASDLKFCMCSSDGDVLLLKRSSIHNDRKWGLPGGNVEEGDSDLIQTARREATEEIGPLPKFKVKGEILTVYAPTSRPQTPADGLSDLALLCGCELMTS